MTSNKREGKSKLFIDKDEYLSDKICFGAWSDPLQKGFDTELRMREYLFFIWFRNITRGETSSETLARCLVWID